MCYYAKKEAYKKITDEGRIFNFEFNQGQIDIKEKVMCGKLIHW